MVNIGMVTSNKINNKGRDGVEVETLKQLNDPSSCKIYEKFIAPDTKELLGSTAVWWQYNYIQIARIIIVLYV